MAGRLPHQLCGAPSAATRHHRTAHPAAPFLHHARPSAGCHGQPQQAGGIARHRRQDRPPLPRSARGTVSGVLAPAVEPQRRQTAGEIRQGLLARQRHSSRAGRTARPGAGARASALRRFVGRVLHRADSRAAAERRGRQPLPHPRRCGGGPRHRADRRRSAGRGNQAHSFPQGDTRPGRKHGHARSQTRHHPHSGRRVLSSLFQPAEETGGKSPVVGRGWWATSR